MEAQRSDLNAKVRLLQEELQCCRSRASSHVGEVVKVSVWQAVETLQEVCLEVPVDSFVSHGRIAPALA